MKQIIDADNMKVIGYFEESETDQKVEELLSTGQWEDVGVDCDGDITCWEEL